MTYYHRIKLLWQMELKSFLIYTARLAFIWFQLYFCKLKRCKKNIHLFSSVLLFTDFIKKTFASLLAKLSFCYVHLLAANFAYLLFGEGNVAYSVLSFCPLLLVRWVMRHMRLNQNSKNAVHKTKISISAVLKKSDF